jgi:hypothetical protein
MRGLDITSLAAKPQIVTAATCGQETAAFAGDPAGVCRVDQAMHGALALTCPRLDEERVTTQVRRLLVGLVLSRCDVYENMCVDGVVGGFARPVMQVVVLVRDRHYKTHDCGCYEQE